MVFTDNFLFLHYPKTGGITLTKGLLKNLKGEVRLTVPEGHEKSKYGEEVIKGRRHENYKQAKQFFLESDFPHSLETFEIILVIIRNPYDYMVSRYHYLNLNKPWDNGRAAVIAREGDFKNFAINAPEFYPTESFIFDERGQIPDNMMMIRFEDFTNQINVRLQKYLKNPINFSRKLNSTSRKPFPEYIIDLETEEAIYKKFKLLFDKGYYNRFLFD